MTRAIRAKLAAILSDRWFLALTVLFVANINFQVLVVSGLLQPRPETQQLNQALRYALLINNFHSTCQSWGFLLPVFLGCRVLADDRASGQLYVTLTGNPRRARFLLGNWAALAGIVVLLMGIVVANYWALAFTLSIKTVVSDFTLVMGTTLMNMLVLLTITAAAASAGTVITGIIGGLGALTLFNLSAFETLPFMYGSSFYLSYPARRLLATVAPIRYVYPPSVEHLAGIERLIVPPYIIDNMLVWQLVFIGMVLAVSLVAFRWRDL